jgi:TetR/AcrR family transcriptional regulator, transcriptional repressor for nem operon
VRLTKVKAEENRRLIVETASRLFKVRGVENVSVADVMKEAGFTHGGFYNHFSSKEELMTVALARAFEMAANDLAEKLASGSTPQKGLTTTLAKYLSPPHRDSRTGGCPAAAFPVDAARNGKDIQAAFADGIEAYLDILAAKMAGDKQEARQEAIAFLSGMVGALLLSRAVKKAEPRLSNELLNSALKQLGRRKLDRRPAEEHRHLPGSGHAGQHPPGDLQ